MGTTNVIAKVLYYAGIIIAVLGVILGFVFGRFEYVGKPGIIWGQVFDWALRGVISGLFLIALSEVLKLLENIKNLLIRN
ncbi:hypothetical protein CWR48_18250 [Oceanobacillus arenosus]|uniref:Uncharacterized protein n=1 Tax=Oceanobacillus arenosus TaxID=1229153 RepID=A0A3D8PLL1_9BACI|nr:hypothetical protein [Oceanobacillus arenosus]RDW16128.1 hypothetical protein CWR48_18250 [Oceanobacillus arenosus]